MSESLVTSASEVFEVGKLKFRVTTSFEDKKSVGTVTGIIFEISAERIKRLMDQVDTNNFYLPLWLPPSLKKVVKPWFPR